jgi:hypothetical protein
MGAPLDTLTLVQRVKRFESIPSSETTFTDTDIVDLMDQEYKSTIVPMIQNLREEHFVITRDIQFPTVNAGQTTNAGNSFQIPNEATGLRLRDMYVLDQQGNFTNIPRLSPELIGSMGNFSWNGVVAGTYGFYLQGNTVQIFPYTIMSGRKGRITYHVRPADLCLTTDAAPIISVVGTLVTVGSTSAIWQAGTVVDAIQGVYPYEYVVDTRTDVPLYASATPLQNVTLVTASGNSFTVDSTIAAILKPGMWLAPTGYSPFPQYIAVDVVPCLVQATAVRCLEAMGDRAGQQLASAKLKQMMEDATRLMTPRVEGKNKKIMNPNSIARSTRMINTRSIV